MDFLEKIRRCSPVIRNATLIRKAFGEDLFEKSRTGIYSNNPVNRKLKRVGQKYGSKKQEEQKPNKESKKPEEKKQKGKSLEEYARMSSEKVLERAIKEHKDENIRKAAHKELERRKAKEYPQEKKK